MKSTVAKENPDRTPFLEKQAPRERLELDGINEKPSALASSSYENVPSTPLPSTKSAKRWGLFGSKKTTLDTPTIMVSPPRSESSNQHELTKKKSKVLKKTKSMCRTKSSADLKYVTPGQADPIPPVPVTPMKCSYAPPPIDDIDTTRISGAALYFTVDPAWDESQGDAHLYFLPSPCARHGELRHNALQPARTPHNTATTTTHGGRSPRNIKAVVGSDNQTSFLFIE